MHSSVVRQNLTECYNTESSNCTFNLSRERCGKARSCVHNTSLLVILLSLKRPPSAHFAFERKQLNRRSNDRSNSVFFHLKLFVFFFFLLSAFKYLETLHRYEFTYILRVFYANYMAKYANYKLECNNLRVAKLFNVEPYTIFKSRRREIRIHLLHVKYYAHNFISDYCHTVSAFNVFFNVVQYFIG